MMLFLAVGTTWTTTLLSSVTVTFISSPHRQSAPRTAGTELSRLLELTQQQGS
jgi:hypothetical protein